jgi:hypothetical protein
VQSHFCGYHLEQSKALDYAWNHQRKFLSFKFSFDFFDDIHQAALQSPSSLSAVFLLEKLPW